MSETRRRLMLVEDSPTQAARSRGLFEAGNLEVVHAATAELALEQLESARPDVIVLDYHLPGMNGDAFCHQIRSNVNTRTIPVLMLTSEDSGSAEMRGLESGADDYVVKSADPDILLARVRALLRKSEGASPIVDVENRFHRARVLAIEDSQTYRHYVAQELKTEHYLVETAGSSEEGLQRLSQDAFDCVLVDFEMPGMDGPEVCRRIRAMDRQPDSEIVLIMLSSRDDKESLARGFEAGADDYISKTADMAVTKARIRALLRRKFVVEENRRILEEMRERDLLNRELEIAREVQVRLFPQHQPVTPGLDYAGYCRPAQGVGGDYYDFLEMAGGRLGIAIADVSGKGIPAALLMASLQASLRGLAVAGAAGLAALMGNLNRLVYEGSHAERYATLFLAQYDPSTGRLNYVNAGHNPPMLFRQNDKVARLDEGGTPVGLMDEAGYEEATTELRSGDLLVAFTDGVSEAMNAAGEDWGERRLMAAIRECQCQSAKETIAGVMRAADAFVADAPQHDDMTVVVARAVL